MKHKAMSSDTVGFIFIFAVFLLVLLRGFVIRAVASADAAEIVYRYTLAMKDREIQLLKDGFEKTAAFYSLMDTAKELGLHGGLSAKSLEINDIPGYIKGVNPPLRFEVQGNERIPYWVSPSTETGECGQTKERVPYLRVTDMGRNIGLKPLGGGKAESEMDILVNVGGKYDSYFKEVNAGKYSLYVALQVFFMKPGTVTVECGDGCVEITELDGTTPQKSITSDEIHEYKITKVSDSVAVLKLKMAASTGENGDGTNIARLKQVVVSIYDKEIDKKGNELFSENLDKFRANLAKALEASSAGKLSVTTIGTLKGALYRGEGGTVAGIVWSPDGIVSETQDYLGNDKLLTLRSSGVTEEEAKIRYWTMYDYAEKFARQAEGLLKYNLWNVLASFEDTSTPSNEFYFSPHYSTPGCDVCSGDSTKQYSSNDIQGKIKEKLGAIAQDYMNLDSSLGWKVELVSFGGCSDKTNKNTGPCMAEDCSGANFEHHEYRKGAIYSVETCPSGYVDRSKRNRCDMQYYHRYVLKNLKVLVTVTDSKNKIFDASQGKWVPLEFKFMVFVPLVDDNCCNGKKCSDFRATDCEKPAEVKPSL